eukprot:Em0018g323a
MPRSGSEIAPSAQARGAVPSREPSQEEGAPREELFKRMAAIDRSNSVAADTATTAEDKRFATRDKTAVNQLMEKVDEAIKLLSDYTARVEAEVKEREDIHELLDAYIWQQKHLLRETKKKMKDHQGKLEKVTKVRQELQSHLASLPDISKLPTNMVAAVPTIGQELAPSHLRGTCSLERQLAHALTSHLPPTLISSSDSE